MDADNEIADASRCVRANGAERATLCTTRESQGPTSCTYATYARPVPAALLEQEWNTTIFPLHNKMSRRKVLPVLVQAPGTRA